MATHVEEPGTYPCVKEHSASKLDYTFSAPAALFPGAIHSGGIARHSYDEFSLDLDGHWKVVPSVEAGTFTFRSEREGATIVVKLGLFSIAEDQGSKVAETNMNGQIAAYRQQCPGGVEVLRWMVRPHPNGKGTEMTYAVEVNAERLFLYFGYVSSRKLIGLLLICRPDREASARLFGQVVDGFRAKCP